MKFRARFDVEYLDLHLPTLDVRIEPENYRDDLESIDAYEWERSFFEDLREERERQMRRLSEYLKTLWEDDGQKEHPVRSELRSLDGDARNRAIRALANAFAIDYRDIRTLLIGREKLNSILDDIKQGDVRLSGTGPIKSTLSRGFRGLWYTLRRTDDPLRENVRTFLDNQNRYDVDPKLQRTFWRAAKTNYHGTRELLDKILDVGPRPPEEEAHHRMADVVRDEDVWTHQLITLRTVQTISVLDLEHYIEIIRKLGRYDT